MEHAAAFQIQIDNMDQKLDDHGKDLREIRSTLQVLASQAERINALQTSHNNLRQSLDSVEVRLRTISEFQASCPRVGVMTNIHALWAVVIGSAGALGAAFIAHVTGGK
jgi:hypothetical protein